MIACPSVTAHIVFDPTRINDVRSLEAACLKRASAFSRWREPTLVKMPKKIEQLECNDLNLEFDCCLPPSVSYIWPDPLLV